MTQQLPPPYFVAGDGVTIVTDKNSSSGCLPVARVNVHKGLKPTRIEPHPTALMFAAAPELLEALEGMLTLQDPSGRFAPSWHKPFLQKAVNAVKKAKGEQ
jgi:hypothetical protein